MTTIRDLSNWWKGLPARCETPRTRRPARDSRMEVLENRVLLYAASGNAWPNKDLITISFMPDGTDLGGATSNLQSTFNAKFGSATTWQNQVLKAAQYWAQQTNINFTVVSDNGAPAGSGSYQQGDPNFGDIRIGGFNFGNSTLAQAYLPPPVNNYSIAGDIQINTGVTFNVGKQYDLFTVMVHEIGHSLGLNHSTTTTACMYATYNGIDSALNADDISGIKAIYSAGAARANDALEANNSTSAAKVVTIDATSKTAVVNNMDLTTSSDLDFFKFTIPSGSSLTLKATVVTQGLSLMNPKIDILDSGGKVLKSAVATSTDYDGTTLTATYTGTSTTMAAGKVFYAKVYSANSLAAFKTGKYALVLNMGTGADPAITQPNTVVANGSTLSSGGGVAYKLGSETLVNAASATAQQTSDRAVAMSAIGKSVVTWSNMAQDGSELNVYARLYDATGAAVGSEFKVNTGSVDDQFEPTVAMDAMGNFIVVWTSEDQDGSLGGIFAQRFDASGNKLGGEFRVNSTTSGDQSAPAVAMDAFGNAVVSWTSAGQDGSGTGVYAQRYNFLGLPVGGEFRVNTTTIGDQFDSTVSMNRLTGDFVFAWTSKGQDGSGDGIYAQRFSGLLGTALGSEFRVNTTTANDQNEASVAVNRVTDDFFVTWTSSGQDGSGKGIYGQRYNASGVAQGTQILINTSTTGDQSKSSVAIDAGGDIYVTWQNAGVSANGVQVYGQQLEKNGLKKEAEFVVNATTSGDQVNASVAIDMLGRAVIVWSGNGAGDTNGVFLQRYGIDLHPFSAEEHDHGDSDDHDHAAAVAPVARPIDEQSDRWGSSNAQPLHQIPFDNLSRELRDRFESQRRSTRLETRSATQLTDSARPGRSRDGRNNHSESSVAIDQLFGSSEWLTGRHYRGVNGRV